MTDDRIGMDSKLLQLLRERKNDYLLTLGRGRGMGLK
jgi:hypothetical protein